MQINNQNTRKTASMIGTCKLNDSGELNTRKYYKLHPEVSAGY